MRLHDIKVKMCAIVGPTAPAIGISLKILPAFWEATLADCMHGRQSEALMAGSGVTADDCPGRRIWQDFITAWGRLTDGNR